MPAAAPTLQTVTVDLGVRSYPIIIGPGARHELAVYLREELRPTKLLVVTDRDLWPQLQKEVESLLRAAQVPWAVHKVWPGEVSKTLKGLEGVLDTAVVERLDRHSAMLAVGGGVVGDLAGLAAALLLRGIPYLQLPTTLLGQVDSAIGGKAAVNHVSGKNLIGTFHQPRAVYCDLDFLAALPARQWLNGFAEMLKYGFIREAALLDDLAAWAPAVPEGIEADALAATIARCVRVKATIVSRDEHERGLRMILNFGHTFGHAFELAAPPGRLLHGEAVARGMRIALAVAGRLGHLDDHSVARGTAVLDRFFTPRLPVEVDRERVQALLAHDKRHLGADVHFISLRRLGEAAIEAVPYVWFEAHLDELLALVR